MHTHMHTHTHAHSHMHTHTHTHTHAHSHTCTHTHTHTHTHTLTQQKLKTEDYRYVHDFLADVRLLLDNARLFYDKGSDEVGCVEELEEVFTLRLQEYAGHFTAGKRGVGQR